MQNQIIANRYKIIKQLDKGGMGTVYLGEHIDLKHKVAIKILNQEARRNEGENRFINEAKTYASINHPNLVQLHEFETTNSYMAMVLEFCNGETLFQFIRNYAPLPVPLAIDIVIQIAQGLSAAHDKRILHRDLKPANIMLIPTTKESKRYQVKLLDFGIAKDLNNNTHLTQQGMVCGTPEYMSPEQACGDRVSNACDIYALGVVFYEMLAGHLPFRDENRQMVMIKHCQQQPPSIKTISPKLEAIVMRCLKKKQEDRYSSVEDLIAALDEFTHSEYGYQSPLEIKTLLQMRLSQMQLEREALKSQGKSLSKDSSQDAPQPISLNMVKPEDIEKFSKDFQQIKYQPSPIQSKKIINYLDHHSVPIDQQNSSNSFDQPSKIKVFFEESFSEFQERFSDPKTKTMILIFATILFLMMTGIILNLIFETTTQDVVGVQELPIENMISKSLQNQTTTQVSSDDINPKTSKPLAEQINSEMKQVVSENQKNVSESKQASTESKQANAESKQANAENIQEVPVLKVAKSSQLGNTPPPLNDAEETTIAITKNSTDTQPIAQSNLPKKVQFKKYIKKNCDPLRAKVFVDEIDILNAKNCLKWELDLNILLNVPCIDLLKKYHQRPNDWIMAVRNSDEIQKQVKECTERVPPGMF